MVQGCIRFDDDANGPGTLTPTLSRKRERKPLAFLPLPLA